MLHFLFLGVVFSLTTCRSAREINREDNRPLPSAPTQNIGATPEGKEESTDSALLHSLLGGPNLLHKLKADVPAEYSPESDRMFLHALGEPFGAGSGFEGSHELTTLTYRLLQTNATVAAMPAQSCVAVQRATQCTALSTLSPFAPLQDAWDCAYLQDLARKLAQALAIVKAMEEDQATFAKTLTSAVQELREGDRLFFPSSWTRHAIAFEIRKEDRQYVFRIYNTGDGVDLHGSAFVGSLRYVVPFADIRGVTEKKLLAPETLAGIRVLRTDAAGNLHSGEFYRHLSALLGGTVHLGSDNGDDFIVPQRSGVCTYTSLSAAFGEHLGDNKRAHWFEFLNQFKTLVDYFRAYPKTSAFFSVM